MTKGITPAVLLIDPKSAGNVGKTLRTCACLGVRQLWYTGTRAQSEWQRMSRLPREERMPRYDVELIAAPEHDWLDRFPAGTVPVAVEVSPTAEDLTWFEHPEEALYVFGGEDYRTLPKGVRTVCERFVTLPSDGPLNLAAAVAWALGDRRTQLIRTGGIEAKPVYDRVRTIA